MKDLNGVISYQNTRTIVSIYVTRPEWAPSRIISYIPSTFGTCVCRLGLCSCHGL